MGILSVYVKDDALLAEIKSEAKRIERSVSWYLVNLHASQKACRDSRKEANPEKHESHRPKKPEPEVKADIATEIKVEEDDAREPVEKKSIKKARAVIGKSSHSEFFNPQPKTGVK